MEPGYTTHRDPSPLPVEALDETGYGSALDAARRLLDDAAAPFDAVIHGVQVRLHTANPHWRRCWSANWFAPEQWAALTGQAPPEVPRVHVYASVPQEPTDPRAGYNRAHDSAFLSGEVPYGPLRALALGAVARLLAEEEAAHFVPGLCLRENGRGRLLLRPPDLDPATLPPAFLNKEAVHLVSWDGVFVRYGLVHLADGVTLLPTLVIDEKGSQTPGYRLFPWLDAYGYQEPRADARCLTLDGAEEYCFARDLDLGRAPEALAYPLEQAWYVPTAVVAAQPELVGALWGAPLENVPPLAPELWDRCGAWAEQAVATLATAAHPAIRALLAQAGAQEVAQALCRLRADPRARALVPPERLWPGRAGGHPWRPLRIRTVEMLHGDGPLPLAPSELAAHLTGEDDDPARTLTGLLLRATDGERGNR